MSTPLKQIVQFPTLDLTNEWLSDRANEKYETEVMATPYNSSTHPVVYSIVYWERLHSTNNSLEEKI